MRAGKNDVCVECGHRRRWHIPIFYGAGGPCCYPLIVEEERNSSGELVGYIQHVDTCGGFVKLKEEE